jgi:hypothetical protein
MAVLHSRAEKEKKKSGATMTTLLGQPLDTFAVSALAAMKDKGDSGSNTFLQQEIMMAGIAQSKTTIEQRQQFKLNDQVKSLYQKKVDAKRMLLNEQKFKISNATANDPECHIDVGTEGIERSC